MDSRCYENPLRASEAVESSLPTGAPARERLHWHQRLRLTRFFLFSFLQKNKIKRLSNQQSPPPSSSKWLARSPLHSSPCWALSRPTAWRLRVSCWVGEIEKEREKRKREKREREGDMRVEMMVTGDGCFWLRAFLPCFGAPRAHLSPMEALRRARSTRKDLGKIRMRCLRRERGGFLRRPPTHHLPRSSSNSAKARSLVEVSRLSPPQVSEAHSPSSSSHPPPLSLSLPPLRLPLQKHPAPFS